MRYDKKTIERLKEEAENIKSLDNDYNDKKNLEFQSEIRIQTEKNNNKRELLEKKRKKHMYEKIRILDENHILKISNLER